MKHNPKHVAEAAERGAEIVGAGRNKDYRLYRLECGHEQEFQIRNMRIDCFRCQACLKNKLVSEAAARGAEIIGAGRDATYRTYKLDCGHKQEILIIRMRKGGFKCKTCLNNKFGLEAAEQGAEIIGAGRDKYSRLYRLQCKHEQEVRLGYMRHGKFRCQACLELKYDAEAAEWGAEIIGAGRNSSYRTYRLECGHEQEFHIGNMRNGAFICHTCEDTSRTLPSYVYLLHIINDENEFLKLGYAKNIDLRISQYRLPSLAKVNHVTALHFDTGSEAHEFENALHNYFKSEKLSERKAKSYGMTRNGYTECYPISMLKQFQKELK